MLEALDATQRWAHRTRVRRRPQTPDNDKWAVIQRARRSSEMPSERFAQGGKDRGMNNTENRASRVLAALARIAKASTRERRQAWTTIVSLAVLSAMAAIPGVAQGGAPG